jgi:predicted secreted hydrolase
MAKLSKLAFLIIIVGLSAWFILVKMSEGNLAQNASTNDPAPTVFGRGIYELDDTGTTLGKQADPNYQISLPKDHFEHTDFDIEWWYLTANLEDENGNDYGLQWTLFRFRNPWINGADTGSTNKVVSTWHNDQVYMAHASVHSMQNHWFAEKFARGGIGNAGGTNEKFELFIDEWRWLNKNEDKAMFPSVLEFSVPLIESQEGEQASSTVLSVELNLTQSGPFVLHGENGYSIKSGNKQHASHYYSAPFINIEGTFNTADNTDAEPIRVSGNAWFDQEWTSQLLDTSTAGWDWMSLHFDDGSKLMAFRMRLNDQEDYMTGSFIQANGELTTLSPKDISLKPVSMSTVNSKTLPLQWQVQIPAFNIDITVQPLKQQQWNPALVSYYEGMVAITGSHTGKGFLELTGY